MRSRFFAGVVFLGLALCSGKAADAPTQQHFSPASFVYFKPDTGSPRLVVYPLNGQEFTIPLPASPPLGRVVYGPDAGSLYALTLIRQNVGNNPGLARIDLGPTRVTTMLNPLGLDQVWSFAVSARHDRIIISGTRIEGGARTCGIFELRVPDRELRPLLLSADCHCGSPWSQLDLSPDGKRAIAHRACVEGYKDHPEFIDLIGGTTSPLGDRLWKGVFSPDGKWIAALEDGPKGISKTVLIDVKDPSRRRDLGGTGDTEIVWSPDSRYILHVDTTVCPWQHPMSLELIDVETGKRSILPNSKCKVPTHFIGWVSNEIGK